MLVRVFVKYVAARKDSCLLDQLFLQLAVSAHTLPAEDGDSRKAVRLDAPTQTDLAHRNDEIFVQAVVGDDAAVNAVLRATFLEDLAFSIAAGPLGLPEAKETLIETRHRQLIFL